MLTSDSKASSGSQSQDSSSRPKFRLGVRNKDVEKGNTGAYLDTGYSTESSDSRRSRMNKVNILNLIPNILNIL